MSMLSDADREWARTIAAKAVFGNDSSNTLCSSAACRNASHGSKEHTCDVCRIELLILAALAKRDAERQPVELSAEDQERISGIVHEQWMETKRSQGITSRKSESGEELMVPYGQLSEPVKELDRVAVRSVLTALNTLLREKRSGK